VSGFLAASASFADNHAIARQYLMPSASKTWNPGWAVTMVSGQPRVSPPRPIPRSAGDPPTPAQRVQVSGPELATLTDSGQYETAGSQGTVLRGFDLVKTAGQWRISNLPDHLLLAQADFPRVYQPRNLYFFGPAGRVLIPDPVFVPLQATSTDLITGLVKALLHGPEGWLNGAAGTALPPGTTLPGSVTLSGGTAIVNLGGAAAAAGQSALERVSAQLVWTLSSPSYGQSAIQSVVLEIDGRPVTLPSSSGGQLQQLGMYPDYAPAAPASSDVYYVGGDGGVQVLSRPGAHAVPVAGQAGTGQVQLAQIAVSPGGGFVAGLSPAGDVVYSGAIARGARLSRRLTGAGLAALSWDRYDDLWVAGRGGVWMLPPDGTAPHQVAMPAGDEPVSALRVAPDGVRIALIARGAAGARQLLLGAITRDGTRASIRQTVPIGAGVSDPAALTWYDADDLVVLTGPGAGGQLVKVPVNGDSPTEIPPTEEAISVTALGAPNPLVTTSPNPIAAGLRDGHVAMSTSLGSPWIPIGAGRAPAYPG